ncbi:MAG: ABC transporter ATP-binding protein [Oscillospiraceae bacterium]
MFIQLTNTTKRIKGSTVIDSVSITLKSGCITGLQGINGSGKTMLMRLISGLIKPTSGTVSIDGKVLWRDISFPDSIGVLIENPAFLENYSAFENLKLIASVSATASDDKIRKSIAQVGLDPNSKKKYKKFSLGMKQRLGIAAAVMESPKILLLDEPTNALDSTGVEMIKEIVQEKKQEGTLVVITCHDAAILTELSDEIYCLAQGKVVDHIVCTADAKG